MYRHRLINYIVLFAFVFSIAGATLAAPAEGAAYTDIANHWAKDDIQFVSGQGIISGFGDGTFKPDRNVTRAEFASMINRTFKLTAVLPNVYSDVKSSDWFTQDIGKARAAGYFSGYGDGTIRPKQSVSRQEAASMIARILGLSSGGQMASIDSYKDKSSIGSWSKDACAAVVSRGYMSGYPDNTFRPTSYIKRGEAAVIMRAVYGLKPVAVTPVTPITPVTSPDTYDSAGTYGPSTGEETVSGNLTLAADGITLRNVYVTGDLTIASTVGSGSVTLNNVRVKGKVYVRGGGANSIDVNNCSIPNMTVSKSGVRVVASGSTTISRTTLESGATLYEGSLSGNGFGTVTVSSAASSGSEFVLKGSFDSLTVSARSDITLSSGSLIKTLTIDAASTTISGSGNITTAYINVSGVVISQTPSNTVVASGLSATVGGKTVKGTGSTDTIAPKFSTGYPDTENVKATYLDLVVKTNEDGYVYWVVLSNGDDAPDSDQVKAGEDADDDSLSSGKHGKTSVEEAEEKSIRISNLTTNKSYDIYVVAEDTYGNLQSSPTREDVTLSDTDSDAPDFQSGYPKKYNVSTTTAAFQVKADEDGYCYYVVLEAADDEPTVTQVKLGKDSDNVLQASGRRGNIELNEDEMDYINVSGLSASTTYSLYAIAADTDGNYSDDVTEVAFTTLTSATTGTIAFSAITASVNEDVGTVSLTVTRTGGSTGAASVAYATSNGTATSGTDYTVTNGTLTWISGNAASKTITVPITADDNVESNETFYVTLSSVSGATLGTNKKATVTIANDDEESAGVIKLAASSYSVNESEGSVDITIERTGGSLEEATIEYETVDGTAADGVDYTSKSGSCTWGDGETADQVISVPITDDGDNEADKTFTFRLQNPNGATLGSPSTATITIVSDDLSSVGPSATNFVANEGDGTVEITVSRTGGSYGAVTLNYETSDISAVAGTDYTAKSGSVTWSNGQEGDKTFSITILDDGLVEAGEKVFTINFSTDDANLDPSSCGVTIIKS